MELSLLRLRQVQAATGLPRSTLYSYIAENNFPKPVQLGPRAVAWRSDDVARWIESRART